MILSTTRIESTSPRKLDFSLVGKNGGMVSITSRLFIRNHETCSHLFVRILLRRQKLSCRLSSIYLRQISECLKKVRKNVRQESQMLDQIPFSPPFFWGGNSHWRWPYAILPNRISCGWWRQELFLVRVFPSSDFVTWTDAIFLLSESRLLNFSATGKQIALILTEEHVCVTSMIIYCVFIEFRESRWNVLRRLWDRSKGSDECPKGFQGNVRRQEKGVSIDPKLGNLVTNLSAC